MNKRLNNINQTVWNLIRKDAAIQKDLQRKLVNMRALAKHFIEKEQLNTGLDAVISSIRRFQAREEFIEENKKISDIFKGSVISTKNNITCITLNLTPSKLFEKICNIKNTGGINYKVMTGDNTVKVVIDSPSLGEIKIALPKENIIKEENELSEIKIKASEKSLNTKGVLAKIAGEIALANINIKEIIVCATSFYIYVKQNDLIKAHEAIIKLIM